MNVQSTADQVLAALQSFDLKPQRTSGTYRCNSPLRAGSNSHAFCLRIDGPERGAFYDQVSGDSGSLYKIAAHFGIDTPRGGNAAPSETAYDYTDGTGKLLFQVVRIEIAGKPKKFFQRQPDGIGGWILNLKNPPVQHVPYRLADVLAAVQAGEPIYIVEGEKDADTLRLYGLTATTNAGGAGKWRPEYNAALQGATVFVLPDNDQPGESHAQQVFNALQGVAAAVHVVKLPGLPPKGDVSDWLGVGNSADDLQTLCSTAAQQPAPTTAAPAPQPASAGPAPAVPQTLSQEIADTLSRLGYTFRLNLCDDTVEVNGVRIDDVIRYQIRMKCRDLHVKPLPAVEEMIVTLAAANSYHPVRDWLLGLQWDGTKRIDTLVDKLTSSDAEIDYGSHTMPTHGVYLRRWLIGAVAKALASEQNLMLVLAGPTNKGKSSFVRWLCSGLASHFIEGSIRLNDKDTDVRLINRFIWEVPELDGTTRRADISELKAFLTKREVTVRKSYGHHDICKPALCSFIGTLNPSSGFLLDETGNRRFMVTTITGIDFSYDTLDINQVWAEVVHLYQYGEPWRLSPVESAHQTRLNQDHEVESPLEGWIQKHFVMTPGGSQRLGSSDIIDHLRANDIKLSGNDIAQSMQLSRVLKRLGVEKIRTGKWRGYEGIAPR